MRLRPKKPLMCRLTFERTRGLTFERRWQKEKQNETKSVLMCETRWQKGKQYETKSALMCEKRPQKQTNE